MSNNGGRGGICDIKSAKSAVTIAHRRRVTSGGRESLRTVPLQAKIAPISASREKTSLKHAASSPSRSDADIIRIFEGIPVLLEQDPALIARGRALDCECLLGPTDHPFHVSIQAGRIADLTPAPVLMRSWRFSYRASSAAWAEYWKSAPRPGWHDLLALTKREQATLEGDLHPFMTHLQYFKDVLALPRAHRPAEPT